MDYGIYTTQGKKVLLGNRATVNGRDAIAYVKNGRLQSYAYMDDFAFCIRLINESVIIPPPASP